jgi:outer membrane protein assembly factor BamB
LAALACAAPVWAEFDGPAPVAWRWAESTSGSPGGTPQVDADNVYVAVGGRFYSLSRKDGNQNWRFPAAEPLDGTFRNGCLLAGDTLVAANDKGRVIAVDRVTGSLKWQVVATGPVVGGIVIAGTNVVYRVGAGELHAVRLADGGAVWEQPHNAGGLTGELGSWQEDVLYATQDGELVSMSTATKKQNWKVRFSRLSAGSGPTVFGDNVYVNAGQYLTALRAQSGGVRWQRRLDEAAVFSPAVSDTGVVATSASGRVFSFDTAGKPVFRKGVDLENAPVAGPAFVGRTIVQSTANGAVNLVDPSSGDVLFSYIIPPIAKGMTAAPTTGGSGGGGGTGGDVAAGGAGGSGGGGGQRAAGAPVEIKYVVAAGPAATAGDSLLVLARDGSLLCFDKRNGVDLSPPEIEMLWPNPGDQVSGQPPMEILVRILDRASGVNPEAISVKIDGNDYFATYKRDGYLSIKVSAGGKNQPIGDGRKEIVVSAADWLGNKGSRTFAITVDNTLPPLGSPRSKVTGAGDGDGGPSAGGKGGGKGGGAVGGG